MAGHSSSNANALGIEIEACFNCLQEKSTALGEALLDVVFFSLFLWYHFAFHFNDLLLQVVLMLTILWFYFLLLLFLISTFAI